MANSLIASFDISADELKTYSFDGSTWSQLGSGLSISVSGGPTLAAMSSTRVALYDSTNDELRAYDFNGSIWSQVGSGLSISAINSSALAALSSTRVAFDNVVVDELRTYEFDGSTWSLVGSGLSIPGAGTPALASLSATRVAYIDSSLDELRTYDFDGSTWSQVGSGLSIPHNDNPALAALSSTRVAFYGTSLSELRAYDFNGSTWSLVGSGLPTGGSTQGYITALSATRVAYWDTTNDELRTYEFSGSSWSQIGSGLSILSSGNALAFLKDFISVVGSFPDYTPSIITAVQKVEQNLPFPQFIIAGQGTGLLYKLFKKSTTYVFNLWRSPVYQIGQNFDIMEIRLPIHPDMTTNMSIIPVLYFDNEDSNSVGTTLNSTNYVNSDRLITLTSKNFSNTVHGRNNFFLELQFQGSALAVVGLPISIDVDVLE